MARKVYIVQFAHPGAEHSIESQEKKTGIKEWNYGSHKRKFLKAFGQCVLKNGSLTSSKDLLFWGEWEPTSKFCNVCSTIGTGVQPVFIHEPFLSKGAGGLILPPFKKKKISRKGKITTHIRQNTDPFVFGDYFLYSNCKQRKKILKSKKTTFTKMGTLEKGSIILFGSTISKEQGGPYFVLDTVFVVGEYKCFNTKNIQTDLSGYVPSDYVDIMGFTKWTPTDYVCYKGASVSNSFDGMFSFVPCKPSDSINVGFPRVKLTSKDIIFISDNLNAAPKYKEMSNTKDMWNKICEIVRSQGFELGVNFKYLV